jgi:hypothetical protein
MPIKDDVVIHGSIHVLDPSEDATEIIPDEEIHLDFTCNSGINDEGSDYDSRDPDK